MFLDEEPDWRQLVAWFLAPIPGIVAWLFLIEWLSRLWGVRAGLILYGVLMLGLVAVILALALAVVALCRHPWEEHGDLMLVATDKGFLLTCTSGIPISYLIVSGQLCRYLYLTFGGFVARSAGYWHWMWLSVAPIADRLIFLVAPGLQSHIWRVQATAPWSKAVVLALDLLLAVGIVGLALLWRAGSWANCTTTQGEPGESM